MRAILVILAAFALSTFVLTLLGQSAAFYGWRSQCIAVRKAVEPGDDEASAVLEKALWSGYPAGTYWSCIRWGAGCSFVVAIYGLYRYSRNEAQLGASLNGGPAEPSGNSRAGGGPPSVS
jgi:hypothetical protein